MRRSHECTQTSELSGERMGGLIFVSIYRPAYISLFSEVSHDFCCGGFPLNSWSWTIWHWASRSWAWLIGAYPLRGHTINYSSAACGDAAKIHKMHDLQIPVVFFEKAKAKKLLSPPSLTKQVGKASLWTGCVFSLILWIPSWSEVWPPPTLWLFAPPWFSSPVAYSSFSTWTSCFVSFCLDFWIRVPESLYIGFTCLFTLGPASDVSCFILQGLIKTTRNN